jgi:carbon-monoxide dehydrogenase large subunit
MTEQLDAGLVAQQIAEHPESMSEPYAGGELGRGRRRKEDAKLVTGQTTWTDNIALPGLLHMTVLRSPMAHARILSVDVSAALEMPGVIAAYSGADLADVMGATMPCAWPVTPDMVSPVHTPLATDEVRYVGDGVAVVVARDRYTAADALEAIAVEYDQLPAVVDMEAALAEGAPLVHSDKGTNRCFLFDFPGAGADYAETVARPATTRSSSGGGSASSACCRPRWSPAASSWRRSRRRTSSRCGRPRRSRTSCG